LRFKEIARSSLRQAELRMKTARNAFREKEFAYCVRQCQECVELALKSALNWVNIEHPRYHDVSPILVDSRQLFPAWFRQNIEDFAELSKELARKRELAMYGEEIRGVTPEQLFTEEEAKQTVKRTEKLLENIMRLVR